jgi:hypothetical protein
MGPGGRALALLIVLAAAAPTGAPAADDVGVVASFYGNSYTQADAMAAAGVGWVRLDLTWSAAEPAPGRYDFSIWDRFVDALEPRGIHTLMILDYGNPLYEGGFPPATDAGRAAFAAFAGAAARHYHGRVAWEIWNEPNVPRFWAGSPDAASYVALARAASAAIRREDPGGMILGPALGGDQFDLPYLEGTFKAGLLDVIDAVSVHPYGAPHPEAAPPFYDQVRTLIRAYGSRLPLVVSEWGYPVEGVGAQGQGDMLTRSFAVNRAAGIPLTIWFNWQEPVAPWHSYGVLDVRGQPKPAYRALQAAAIPATQAESKRR